jgi:alpha-L-fucosidase
MNASSSSALVPAPLPRIARFESLGYGMFLHWGLYSQLGRGEWVQWHEKISVRRYAQLERKFTAADFDARAWARLARRSGMRYAVLTTRHHEGFSLYDTRGLSEFDAPHSPARRDLVAEFVAACRAEELLPLFYHTTLDWRWDTVRCSQKRFAAYLDYLHASVEVLCRYYGPIGGLWFDGNWSRPKADWKEERLYGLIRRWQPEALIINNTGIGAEGALGHREVDSTTFEQSVPRPVDRHGWPKHVAVEMCRTMNHHWGIGARDLHYLSPGQIIETLAQCRGAGANLLLNVGPTAQGGIPEYEAAALTRAGDWVALHEKAIRAAHPVAEMAAPGRDFVLRAATGKKLYYFAFDLGIEGNAHVTFSRGLSPQRAVRGVRAKVRSVRWLDNRERLAFSQNRDAGLLALDLTPFPYGSHLVVRVAEIALD